MHRKYLLILIYIVLGLYACTESTEPNADGSYPPGDSLHTLAQIDSLVEMGVVRGGNTLKPAIAYFDTALNLALEMGDAERAAYCRLNKAMVYANYRHFDSTLYYINHALEYYGQSAYSADQTMCFMLASDVYAEMGKFSKAEEYYKRGVSVSETAGDSIAMVKAKVFGIVLFAKQNRMDESLELGYACMRLLTRLPYTDKLSLEHNNVFNNMAAVYASTGKVDSADLYFNKSLEVAKVRQDSQLISFIFDNLSRNYAFYNKDKKALDYSDSASYYMNAQKPRFYQGYLRNRILLQKKAGDVESSLITARMLIQELDSSMVRVKRLTTDELLYDLERLNYSYRLLEAEHAKLAAEKRFTVRNTMMIISLLLLVIILVVFYFERRRAKAKILIENQKVQAANDKLEIMTKMQSIHAEHVKREAVMMEKQHIAIQLHNTVANSLAGILFRMKNTDQYKVCSDVQDRLQDIYIELRSVIESEQYVSRTNYFSNQTEFRSFVHAYFADMPIEVEVIDGGEVDLSTVPIENITTVGMALKEVFVNALKHSSCTKISVRMVEKDMQVQIEVRDNGAGFETKSLNVNKQTGLMSVKQDVEQLPFGAFEIQSEIGKGTQIQISFAL